MRPLLSSVMLASALVFLSAYSASQQSVADVVKQSSDAVVLIVIFNAAGQETALGSGFLVSADGEIVTNYHVIKEAHSATVKLSNGAFFPVSGVLASDADRDLAIIKVDGKGLPFLALGDFDKLHVGDHVVAIGNPGLGDIDLEGTVSDGIVSAVDRVLEGKKWIQTTAAISHGNSGGPLLDMSGHVVGVITLAGNPALVENLNFAIPCSDVAALLATARQQVKPLDSVADRGEGTFTEGTLWTSVTGGRDLSIRHDGDYLYVDWVSIPSDVKTSGGFVRDELKRSPDGKWRGKRYSHLPCKYDAGGWREHYFVTNWCSSNIDIEIDLLSDKRIEGIFTAREKFDCYRCKASGEVKQTSFTWIPK